MEGGGEFLLQFFIQLQFGGEKWWRWWRKQDDEDDITGGKYPSDTTVAAGEDTRLEILMTTIYGVGDKEVRRRRIWRNTAELNRNFSPDQYQYIVPDWIKMNIPPITLTNPHIHHHHFERRQLGSGDGHTQASGRVGGGEGTQRNKGRYRYVRRN